MDVTPEIAQHIAALEWTAMGLVAVVIISVVASAVFIVRQGIPALIKYHERKDEAHRIMIMKVIADCREEREMYYKTITAELKCIHNRIDKLIQYKGEPA